MSFEVFTAVSILLLLTFVLAISYAIGFNDGVKHEIRRKSGKSATEKMQGSSFDPYDGAGR